MRRRGGGAFDEVTAQEAETVQLTVAGRSNPEIGGAQLFLSPETVEWYLCKVFIKVGVSSRRKLAGALHATGRTAESACIRTRPPERHEAAGSTRLPDLRACRTHEATGRYEPAERHEAAERHQAGERHQARGCLREVERVSGDRRGMLCQRLPSSFLRRSLYARIRGGYPVS